MLHRFAIALSLLATPLLAQTSAPPPAPAAPAAPATAAAPVPKTVKVVAVAKSAGGPYVPLTMDTARDRSYPLWGEQSFWVEAKPGRPLDPKVSEFIRFVLSRQGQELVQRDGKYLPLTAKISAEQMSRLNSMEAGHSINGEAPGAN